MSYSFSHKKAITIQKTKKCRQKNKKGTKDMDTPILLSRQETYEGERDLYIYAGYYKYNSELHDNKHLDIYVKTDAFGLGYQKRTIYPGTCWLHEEPDMATAIVFNRKTMTVTTGSCEMDPEMMRIIQARAKELGFESANQSEILKHKLRKILENGQIQNLTMKELQQTLQLAIGLDIDEEIKE